MNRRLIKQGGGGFTIYLPKKWVDRKKLKAGDEISVKESSTGLILDTSVKGTKEKIITITDDNKKDISNILTHLYRRAFDKITINNCDETTISSIKDTINNLMLGFEVTSQEKRKIIIENVSEPTGEKYEALLRRVFLIIKETHSLIHAGLSSGKLDHTQVAELKQQQDKYILFCRRTLAREISDTEHPLLHWELLTFLMHIQHALYYMSEYANKNKIKIGKKELELLSQLGSYFQLLYDAHYDKDLDKIHKINRQKTEYQFGKCYDYLEKSKGKETVYLSQLRELFRLIQVSSSSILSELTETS